MRENSCPPHLLQKWQVLHEQQQERLQTISHYTNHHHGKDSMSRYAPTNARRYQGMNSLELTKHLPRKSEDQCGEHVEG